MKKVSVIITRYNETNDLVIPCLEAVSKQKGVSILVYFLDQKKDEEIKKLSNRLSNKNVKIIYKNIPVKSLSYARNIGAKISKENIVLFTDADGIPKTNWAFELLNIFIDRKGVAIVGGKSIPKWLSKPRWYHKSNILMDKYSVLELGNGIKKVEEIVGVNFGLNKKVLKKEAFFDEKLGRKPGSLSGGEESDLCNRAKTKGFKVFYNGKAIVEHQIQKDRMSLKWIIRRFYFAGRDKAIIGGSPKTYATKRNIYDLLILFIIIFPYILGFLKYKFEKFKGTSRK